MTFARMVWQKHANMFSYISMHVIVFVKTRKSDNHWLALKTKIKISQIYYQC